MRNFQLIAQGVNVTPLLHQIQLQPDLWNANPLRTFFEQSPHKEADDIWLRFNEIPDDLSNIAEVVDDKICVNYPAFAMLPAARPIIFDLMRAVEGEQLGRVIITRLAPGRCIYPHEDGGAPAEFYDRYHVMLQNNPGSTFKAGDEEVFMRPGDVWHFDNRKTHSVTNNSRDDRITMICDIRANR